MDGMLSQDEINALLQGMDLSDTADSGASPETPQDSSSAENTDNAYVKDVAPTVGDEEELTDVEKDAIGEVANISMGSSATTLFTGKPQSKYYHSGGYTGHMEDFAG